MQNLKELIAGHRSYLLTGHENPDGDCLGAEVALYHLLRALGREVAIVNPDPLPRGFDFLQANTPFGHYSGSGSLPEFEVAVLLDCCQLSRTGALGSRIRSSGAKVAVIDHHIGSEDGDGDVAYVDATAAATGVLVRRLYAAFDQPLTPVAAEGVFLSLVMDTGWFRYSNTDHEVLSMAAELVGVGVDVCGLYDRLYRRMHPEVPALLATCLRRSEMHLDGRLALVGLDRSMTERIGQVGFDTDLVIDPLRSIDGVEVVALLKERFDGAVKLSLRSKQDVDVQAIAASFGGGGHRKAAGAGISGSLVEATAAVVARVRAELETSGQEHG